MAKSNKIQRIKSINTPLGRPALFVSDLDLQKAIDDYFIFIEGKGEYRTLKAVNGTMFNEFVWERRPVEPTITGLAYFLGFESRQSFYDYERNGDFSYTIKRARLYIESMYEAKLTSQYANGAIFALKNFGWRDQPEPIDQNKLNIIIE